MTIVNLIYRLSPAGRKAAIMAGEPANADVTRQVEVSLALYADVLRVDTRGNAEIYTPAYIDQFDATPSVEECANAIRTAKAELAERKAAENAKNEAEAAEREKKIAAAEAAFLADPAARVEYPANIGRWFRFAGVETRWKSDNPAHAEAQRRYESDQAEAESRAAAKARNIWTWTSAFLGRWSAEMLARFDAGLLPDSELQDAVRDYAFSPLNPASAYAKLHSEDVDCECYEPGDVTFRSFPAESATAGEFAALEKLRAAVATNDRLENAEVTLRTHVAECECGAKTTRTGILVVANCGPFGVRREFAAEEN